MQWWVVKNSQRLGPFELLELVVRAEQGELSPTDLVWRVGLPDWTPAGEIPGLLLPPPLPVAGPCAQPPPCSAPWHGTGAPSGAAASSPDPASLGGQQSNRPPSTSGKATQAGPSLFPEFRNVRREGSPSVKSAGAGPIPPRLHWGVVLFLSLVTFGLFAVVWMFVQANFVKKIDPQSNAGLFLAWYIITPIAFLLFLPLLAENQVGRKASDIIGLVATALAICAVVLFYAGYFAIRRSLVHYYNSVDNIQLQLSRVMVFFFSILYVQYHLTRIFEWKETGRLDMPAVHW